MSTSTTRRTPGPGVAAARTSVASLDARGGGGAAGWTTGRHDRLPAGPRERRPALIALAALLVVGGAAVAGLLALRLDDRSDVLVARRPIAAGALIAADDLAVARVAADGLALVPAAQREDVIGRFASSVIPAGRLLDADMVTTRAPFGEGDAAVGVSVEPGRGPASGLQPGDVVQVVGVRDGAPTVITDGAVVSTVTESGGGGLGGGSSGSYVATLITTPELAPSIAAAAFDNSVALVLLQRNG